MFESAHNGSQDGIIGALMCLPWVLKRYTMWNTFFPYSESDNKMAAVTQVSLLHSLSKRISLSYPNLATILSTASWPVQRTTTWKCCMTMTSSNNSRMEVGGLSVLNLNMRLRLPTVVMVVVPSGTYSGWYLSVPHTHVHVGVDDLLAQHVAHLFIRDSVSLFAEKLEQSVENESDHFEVNIKLSHAHIFKVC